MFLKPFSVPVWVSVAAVAASCSAMLVVSTLCWPGRLAPEDRRAGPADCLNTVIGVLCQQGSYYMPHSSSGRLTLLTLLLANLFLYSTYSASILAQSQGPSEALPSPDSLLASGYDFGAESLPWVRFWFEAEKHGIIKMLYETKLMTQDKAFLRSQEGIAKVRRGRYAFQVDLNEAWTIIQDTFLESEKCDLHVMELFPQFTTSLVAVKMSPYREAMARIVRWLRETGHIDRTSRRWLSRRPLCASGLRGFTAVGLREAGPPMHLLLCGGALAVAFLGAELLIALPWAAWLSRLANRLGLYVSAATARVKGLTARKKKTN